MNSHANEGPFAFLPYNELVGRLAQGCFCSQKQLFNKTRSQGSKHPRSVVIIQFFFTTSTPTGVPRPRLQCCPLNEIKSLLNKILSPKTQSLLVTRPPESTFPTPTGPNPAVSWPVCTMSYTTLYSLALCVARPLGSSRLQRIRFFGRQNYCAVALCQLTHKFRTASQVQESSESAPLAGSIARH